MVHTLDVLAVIDFAEILGIGEGPMTGGLELELVVAIDKIETNR